MSKKWMIGPKIIVLAGLVSAVLSMGAYAAAPVALIEDITAKKSTLSMLDFVSPGDVVDLGDDGSLTLGYMDSCVREQITGGKVTVGTTESTVAGGKVQRNETQCDGARLSLAANQSLQAGAIALRSMFDTEPKLTVYDTKPFFVMTQAGRLSIKRIDEKGERHKLTVEADTNGKVHLDLAEQGIELMPNGVYMASTTGKTLVFKVAGNAGHNPNDMLSRVVPL